MKSANEDVKYTCAQNALYSQRFSQICIFFMHVPIGRVGVGGCVDVECGCVSGYLA